MPTGWTPGGCHNGVFGIVGDGVWRPIVEHPDAPDFATDFIIPQIAKRVAPFIGIDLIVAVSIVPVVHHLQAGAVHKRYVSPYAGRILVKLHQARRCIGVKERVVLVRSRD